MEYAQQYTGARLVLHRIGLRLSRLKRFIPRLVWPGDEVDVVITFTENKLQQDANPLRQLWQGALPQIEMQLAEIGVEFDKGLGPDGRDWEWDWSLRGPVRVKFRSRAKRPHLRQ